MSAFVIEKDGEIKEKFSYEILFNKTTQQSLVAYCHANYGPEAVFRSMTDEENADFIAPAQDSSLLASRMPGRAAISEGTYRIPL
jgi:hypothetical protein